MVDQVTCKLKVAPTVLVERGKEGVELLLGEADDVSGSFFSKLFKVELGGGAECFCSGLRSRWGWQADHIRVDVNRGGLEGVGVDKGDAGVSKQGGVLWAGGCKEREARDNELRAGGNSGRPGDDRGRYGTRGVLETGASGTWVIPSVVGTVEDVVDNLKGGGRVLLVDGVQVGPRGDGEGR